MLKDILNRLEETPGAGVVFDLDSTLFDNGPRTWRILSEFARHERRDLIEPMQKLQRHRLPYDLRAICDLAVPGEGAAIAAEAKDFWAKRFFSEDYIDFDEPITGAVEFVQACHRRRARVIYLTGRDVPGMIIGTSRSLRNWGFPIGVAGTELVLKPRFDMPDPEFKAEAIRSINTHTPNVVATFENEAKNSLAFREIWPDAVHLLLETNWDPRHPAELRDSFEKIHDFRLGT
ncbi:MAG: hypothetical protein CMH55_04020 [Myxococcales bacterium]|nr:hypothetical protein [Myxococcales bacterium]